MEGCQALLGDRLDGDREDLLVAVRLQQREGIGGVGLVAQDITAGVMHRQQTHAVAQLLECPRPVVGRTASLQQNRGRWPVGEESHHLTPGQTSSLADAAGVIGHGDLKHGLGQIHGDGRMLLHGLLLSRAAMTPNHVGTQMPFTRWEESISSLQRTRLRSPLSRKPLGDGR